MKLSDLPFDVLCSIVAETDIYDVVSLRQVSRRLRDITYESALWRCIYAASYLPRPHRLPPFQPRQLIERALMKTARASRNIFAKPPVASSFSIPVGRGNTFQLLRGRYLISSSHTEVRCRDLNRTGCSWAAGDDSTCIYAVTHGFSLNHMQCAEVTDREGNRHAFVTINEQRGSNSRIVVFNANVHEEFNIPNFSQLFEYSHSIPPDSSYRTELVVGPNHLFLFAGTDRSNGLLLTFDVHCSLVVTEIIDDTIVEGSTFGIARHALSKTHLIVLRPYTVDEANLSTLSTSTRLEAYPLSDIGRRLTHPLRLSQLQVHEPGDLPSAILCPVSVLRDSVIDSCTGATDIVLHGCYSRASNERQWRPEYVVARVQIPPTSSDEKICAQIQKLDDFAWRAYIPLIFQPSFNGCSRGVYSTVGGLPVLGAYEIVYDETTQQASCRHTPKLLQTRPGAELRCFDSHTGRTCYGYSKYEMVYGPKREFQSASFVNMMEVVDFS